MSSREDILKITKIVLIYRADDKTPPSNSQQISILISLLRSYKKISQNHLTDFIDTKMIFYLCSTEIYNISYIS